MYISVLAILVLAYFSYLVLLYFAQDYLIFLGVKPNHLLYKKLEDYSEDLVSDSCILQGWKIQGASPDANSVVIYFGGNAEDTSGMLPILKQMTVSLIYTYNYRGYGLSEGKASEHNIYQDALAIYNHVVINSQSNHIVIIGHSLGSAAAGYLASKREIEKLILLSPLSSLTEVAQLNFKNSFPEEIIKHKFELKEHVRYVNAHTLVIVAEDDSIIPNSHSLKTFNNLKVEKKLIKISDANHNSLFVSDDTINKINQFI